MSGGSMEYLYSRVENAQFVLNSPQRRAFHGHLQKVANALHAIEWNDSGDGADNEFQLIEACLCPGAVLEAAVISAKMALAELRAELKRVKL